MPPEDLKRLRESLAARGVKLREGEGFEEKLSYLRSLYEPYAVAIAVNLSITLPPWIHPEKRKDNWQAGPWDRAIQARSLARARAAHGRSFLIGTVGRFCRDVACYVSGESPPAPG